MRARRAALPRALVAQEQRAVRGEPLVDARLHLERHHEVRHLLRQVLRLAASAVEELGVLARLRRVHVEEAVVPRLDALCERALWLGAARRVRRLAVARVGRVIHRAIDEGLQPVQAHVDPTRLLAGLILFGEALLAPRLLPREYLGRGRQIGRILHVGHPHPLLLPLLGSQGELHTGKELVLVADQLVVGKCKVDGVEVRRRSRRIHGAAALLMGLGQEEQGKEQCCAQHFFVRPSACARKGPRRVPALVSSLLGLVALCRRVRLSQTRALAEASASGNIFHSCYCDPQELCK